MLNSEMTNNGQLPESCVKPDYQDQYADGVAAKQWKNYIGDQKKRTENYRNFLVPFLKNNGVNNILDVACGGGVDSIMLLEQGFQVTSSDGSSQMLQEAYKTRWQKRDQKQFYNWEIIRADWLALDKKITPPGDGFDAVICMGNSFAHLLDTKGDCSAHRLGIQNFYNMVKPGGIFIIDHRNFDYIVEHGVTPSRNIYYNSKHIKDLSTSVVRVNNVPMRVKMFYTMEGGSFQLSYYPHKLENFTNLIRSIFGEEAEHTVYGDFKPLGEVKDPGMYIHIVQKIS